jgi:hypothetical protein
MTGLQKIIEMCLHKMSESENCIYKFQKFQNLQYSLLHSSIPCNFATVTRYQLVLVNSGSVFSLRK